MWLLMIKPLENSCSNNWRHAIRQIAQMVAKDVCLSNRKGIWLGELTKHKDSMKRGLLLMVPVSAKIFSSYAQKIIPV